jgi:hypothetical protein
MVLVLQPGEYVVAVLTNPHNESCEGFFLDQKSEIKNHESLIFTIHDCRRLIYGLMVRTSLTTSF